MPGDYSRKLFNRKKHYSAVLEQQGRVQLDADWNEQSDIQQYRISTETKDVIGLSGVPKANGGFNITLSSDGTDLQIASGRIYVDGLLFELDDDATYQHQPYYLNPDLSFFMVPSSPTSPPASAIVAGTYIAYLIGWQREINFHDDPHIQEVALGEADTTTRLQNDWQVRLLKVGDNAAATCKADFPEWNALVAPPTGMLNAKTISDNSNKKPCVLPPSAGFRSLENQLYRVQIVQEGDQNTATYTWSRDNASIETIITDVSGSVVTVSETGKDEILSFADGQWVELVETEPTLPTGRLVKIDHVDPDSRKITLDDSVLQYENKPGLKLRRWDIAGNFLENGIGIVPGWVDIENGIQISFSNGSYKEGDYWLIPARTATSDIEWPVDAGFSPIPQAPVGIVRHFSRLALITATANNVNIKDCRLLFPTLTGICAEDICFNNTNCQFPGVNNVQDALDMLCEKTSGGSCTLVASPGPGWESVFSNIAAGMDAQICFQTGVYPLKNQMTVMGKGNLSLVGCGPGTKIIALSSEAALIFDNCSSVNIHDMYAESRAVNTGNNALTKNLNGVFTFRNCGAVNADHLVLKSGTSLVRNCTCLTVKNDLGTPCPVRIEDCDLWIADKQQGILIVNTTECWIERNNLKVYDSAPGTVTTGLLRAPILHSIISNANVGVIGKKTAANNVTLTAGGFSINFKTDSALKDEWHKVLAANPPVAVKSAPALLAYVQKLGDKIVANEAIRSKFPQFKNVINTLVTPNRSIGAQGITIGGQVGKDIRISDNSITDVLQGIHIGVSHDTAVRQPDSLQNLSIVNNSLSILVPQAIGKQDRYGIFVGNCQNLLIENNSLQLERLPNADNVAIDGIRAWGIFGTRVMITKNLLQSFDGNQKRSFDIGIHVNPLQAKPTTSQWVIMWNVAPSKISTIKTLNNVNPGLGTNTP